MISYARTSSKFAPQPNDRLEVMKVEFNDYPGDTNQTEGINTDTQSIHKIYMCLSSEETQNGGRMYRKKSKFQNP